MTITFRLLTPEKLTAYLSLAIFSLVLLSSLERALVPGFGLFYVDDEANVPVWYSSFALLLASVLAGLIAAYHGEGRDPYRLHWAGLCVLFLLLSVDEVSMVHEYPDEPLRRILDTGGLLYYAWVLPGSVAVGALTLIYWRFVFNLPARTRKLMILSAVTFVGGAIGVEMLSGLATDRYGGYSARYDLVITVEESLEMIGVVVFIHALMEYLQQRVGAIHVRIGGRV